MAYRGSSRISGNEKGAYMDGLLMLMVRTLELHSEVCFHDEQTKKLRINL